MTDDIHFAEPDPVVLRQEAYRNEADPLFFKWQRDEATEQDWLDKVTEIRARFPYPCDGPSDGPDTGPSNGPEHGPVEEPE